VILFFSDKVLFTQVPIEGHESVLFITERWLYIASLIQRSLMQKIDLQK
jgi:hypothetical protein